MTDDNNECDYDRVELADFENESKWVRPGRPWLKGKPDLFPKSIKYPKFAGFHCLLKKSNLDYPNNVLMHFPETDKKYTLYETTKNVDILTNAFEKEYGIKKGDGIAIMTPNNPEYIFTVYASSQSGATLIPVNPLLKKKEVKHVIDNSQIIKLFIVDERMQGIVKRAAKETGIDNIIKINSSKPDDVTLNSLLEKYKPKKDNYAKINLNEDLGAILYTGGTTGLPKGVMLTHSNIIANSIQFLYSGVAGIYRETFMDTIRYLGKGRSLTSNPLCHGMGFFVLNACVSGGFTLIIYANFRPGEILKMIEKYELSSFSAVPTAYNFIVNHPNFKTCDLSTLEMCGSGAAALPEKVAKVWKDKTGLKVINAYGCTEVTCMATVALDWLEIKPESISSPIIDTDMKIVDPPDYITEVPPGTQGELLIRGPQVMKGYWRNPEATKGDMVEDENGDIWVRTGDLGKMDEQGYFYIVGRSKEMIKYKAYKILPAEVENGLYEHPAILECAVIGVPDPEEMVGERVKAFIKLKPEYQGKITLDEIQDWTKENMAAYKWPRLMEFTNMIPKTPVGKVKRRALLLKELKKQEQG